MMMMMMMMLQASDDNEIGFSRESQLQAFDCGHESHEPRHHQLLLLKLNKLKMKIKY